MISLFFLQLDVQLQDEAGGDISSFITNGEWDLLGNYIPRNKEKLRMFSSFSSSIKTLYISGRSSISACTRFLKFIIANINQNKKYH